MLNFLVVIRDFSWMLYAGPLIGFGILMTYQTLFCVDQRRKTIEDFCSWGPVFGLALGFAIFSALGVKWIADGHFWLSLNGESNALFSIGVVIGFVLWVSNIVLEIWTLEPIRKSVGSENQLNDKNLSRVVGHICLQSTLAAATTLLCTYAGLV